MDSDSSWEAHSITEEILAPSSDSEAISDSDSSEFSSPEDGDPQQDREDQPEEVRGAKPYRFEPLAPPPPVMPEEHRGEDGEVRDWEELEQNRLLNTDWCTCGKCVVQTNVDNCKCCKEVDAISNKMLELNIDIDDHEQCVTQHDWFEACCLHPAVLHTAHMQYQMQYGRRAVQGTIDQKFRHVAYRQVVRWCWGYLGRFNCVPLPSCVMEIIRTTYPNPEGEYKGFKYPDLD